MQAIPSASNVKPTTPVRSIRVICGPLPPEGAIYVKIRVDGDEAEYRVTRFQG